MNVSCICKENSKQDQVGVGCVKYFYFYKQFLFKVILLCHFYYLLLHRTHSGRPSPWPPVTYSFIEPLQVDPLFGLLLLTPS